MLKLELIYIYYDMLEYGKIWNIMIIKIKLRFYFNYFKYKENE